VLAVQMPRNFGAPSHTMIADTVRAGPWRARLEPLLKPSPVAEPGYYYGVIAPRVAQLDIWETEYLQVLDGIDPVKEWTKGTWLKQFLDALDQPQRSAFESDYAARVRSAYPMRDDGRTLFPFRRLFIVCVTR
jgi:trans-aconitate 2-methyltransferase